MKELEDIKKVIGVLAPNMEKVVNVLKNVTSNIDQSNLDKDQLNEIGMLINQSDDLTQKIPDVMNEIDVQLKKKR